MTSTVTYCMNGHYIALTKKVVQIRSSYYMPVTGERGPGERPPAFCSKCGAKTISACAHCNADIERRYPGEVVAYCGGCGKPFPWTETALTAAKEYTDDLDGLSEDEKVQLKATFEDMTTDTARTPLATGRFKRFMAKVAPEAGKGLVKVIVSVLTEEAKKQLGLTQ